LSCSYAYRLAAVARAQKAIKTPSASASKRNPAHHEPGLRILVIEHERVLGRLIERSLASHAYAVQLVRDGAEGEASALSEPVDLVVLDRSPGCDGLDVLGAIQRAKPTLPVIMLGTPRPRHDSIECLDRGAVDYLVKPFSPAELAARVRAHLRTACQATDGRLRRGDIELDRLSRRVRRADREVRLSALEANLLAHFMHNPGLILSREHLRSAVWRCAFDPGTNVVDVYVGYLRRKLGRPSPIETVRGEGYRFVEDARLTGGEAVRTNGQSPTAPEAAR
jgi:DNA-binding response OmpR family regulator